MNHTMSAPRENPQDSLDSNPFEILHALTRHLFRISPAEVSIRRRRFQVSDLSKQDRIETIGSYFLLGYHAAIENSSLQKLRQALDSAPIDYRGFAFEGASMGVSLLAELLPWGRPTFSQFLLSDWNPYPYLTHVGLGWALARVPGGIKRFANDLATAPSFEIQAASTTSLLSCLVLDGYGFHQAYFAWKKYVKAMEEPAILPTEGLPVFRQGVGRSLSFVMGMDGTRIANTIQQFPKLRQNDLWSGVGLATAYAGGLGEEEVNQIKHLAAEALPSFAQGIAFAAKARQWAQHVPDHTHQVCQLVWGRSVERVVELTDATLAQLPPSSPLAAYAAWRERLQHAFASATS